LGAGARGERPAFNGLKKNMKKPAACHFGRGHGTSENEPGSRS
jgi:hypothetical protein